MKTIIFNGEISYDSVKELINEIESSYIGSSKEGFNIKESIFTIYFNSYGGNLSAARILVDYFEMNRSLLKTRLVASHEISSCAFYVFFKANVNIKHVADGCVSKIHIPSYDLSTRDLNDKNSFDSFIIKDLDKDSNDFMSLFSSLGLTKQELSKIKKGQDVFLDSERLKKMINGSK